MSARWISLVLSIWWTPDRSSCATQAAEMGACERDSRLPLPTRSLSKLGGPSREHLAAPARVRKWHISAISGDAPFIPLPKEDRTKPGRGGDMTVDNANIANGQERQGNVYFDRLHRRAAFGQREPLRLVMRQRTVEHIDIGDFHEEARCSRGAGLRAGR